MSAVGYSGKPVWEKLGLKPGIRLCVLGEIEQYLDLVGLEFEVDHVEPEFAQIVHVFCTSRDDLATKLAQLWDVCARDVSVWVSWPKKASKVSTEIDENVIREICLPMGCVDVKVCAVSDVWSGLKLVVRKELR